MQPNPFVGREKELEAVQALVSNEQVRVLTLTGTGGTGKTRLSLQASANLIDNFPDGVFFVDLSAIDSAAHVIPMIARTLEVRETGARPLKSVLQDALRDKRMLLILDNFEQVMAGVPHIVDLLSGCSLLKLLVTSREALHIRAERVFRVPPLSVPKLREAREMVPSRLSQYEAVTLFIERATAVVPDFTVTNENAPAVAEICARLDGLPLAIELAAARVNMLMPQAILERLGNRLKLLSGGATDLPHRQRTLRATIDWSYRLLSSDEQVLFREMSVFSGGCTLNAAESVCGSDANSCLDVFETLSSLLSKSLLVKEERKSREDRFQMFESLKEYGGELLATHNEEKHVRTAHARYYAALAERVATGLQGNGQKNGLDTLEEDHDNLHGAIDWLHRQKATVDERKLCISLGTYWQVRGYLSEGIGVCKNALAEDDSAVAEMRGELLMILGALQFEKGEYEKSAGSLRSALEIFRPLRKKTSIAFCYVRLGWDAYKLNDFALAERFFSAVRAGKLSADPSLLASAEKGLGSVAYMLDKFDDSRALLERSRDFFRSNGDMVEHARVLDDLATLYSRRKDYPLALSYSHEALALWESIGDLSGILTTYNNLGFLNLQIGNSAEARRCYERLLSAGTRAGNLRWQSLACSGIADACLLEGDNDGAAGYSSRAEKSVGAAGWEMEKGIVCRIKAEIHRRAGRYQESVVLFKRSRELLGLAKDIEDLEIADKGFAKAVEQMKASR
jgi:predicted ATPase